MQLRQQWFESGCEWYLVAIGNVNGSVNVAFGVVQWPDLGQMLARCSSAPESARLAIPWARCWPAMARAGPDPRLP